MEKPAVGQKGACSVPAAGGLDAARSARVFTGGERRSFAPFRELELHMLAGGRFPTGGLAVGAEARADQAALSPAG